MSTTRVLVAVQFSSLKLFFPLFFFISFSFFFFYFFSELKEKKGKVDTPKRVQRETLAAHIIITLLYSYVSWAELRERGEN